MYIPDLASRSYIGFEGPIRAVGWLQHPHPFSRGRVDDKFVQRLLAHIDKPPGFLGSRGYYSCSLCAAGGLPGPNPLSSQAEILIPAGDYVFEAPVYIGHYVIDHGYRPPDPFIDAIMKSPAPGSCELLHELCDHIPDIREWVDPNDERHNLSLFMLWNAERTLRRSWQDRSFMARLRRWLK